jgi:acyl carrier protein
MAVKFNVKGALCKLEKDLIAKIIRIIAEIKGNQDLINRLSKDTKILDDVGMDSLEMINFIFRVEEEFGLEIDFEYFDYNCLDTVDSFRQFLMLSSIKGETYGQ